MARPFEVEHARIEWLDDGTPRAEKFGDTYFSRGQGLSESSYLFIEQNRIADRSRAQDTLTVAELGFGTALNFLLTWKVWLENRQEGSMLNYVAFEQFPLTGTDLQQALSHWPELAPLTRELQQKYQTLLPGFRRMVFEDGAVILTLLIGDARQLLEELESPVDVWYLDGFAPARNPELWGLEICSHLKRLSHPSTTFSSFTAASHVRTSLQQAGFEVQKIPGHGRKRESICGHFIAPPGEHSLLPPWKRLPRNSALPPTEPVVIAGGGLAGFGAALALCSRGYRVTLLERSSSGPGGASGNPAGIFTPYLAREFNRTCDLYLTSFLFSLLRIQEIERKTGRRLLHQTGALQLLHTKRLELLASSLEETGVTTDLACLSSWQGRAALHFPHAGWISAPELCSAIEEFFPDSLSVIRNCSAVSLAREGSGWLVNSSARSPFEAQAVIIASAQHSSDFEQTRWIPLEPIRGELIQIAASPESEQLNQVIMGNGYLLPAYKGAHLAGATYIHQRMDLTPDALDQKKLKEQAVEMLPCLAHAEICGGRVSFRTSTHHRLPYVGPVVDQHSFNACFQDLKKGYPADHYQMPEYHPNLYVSAGHGSRGLVSTLAAGELLAGQIRNFTPLFRSSLASELNPVSALTKKIFAS